MEIQYILQYSRKIANSKFVKNKILINLETEILNTTYWTHSFNALVTYYTKQLLTDSCIRSV